MRLIICISQGKQSAKESRTKWTIPCVPQPDKWASHTTEPQTKRFCQDWGLTDTQGNRINLTAVEKVVDADCAFTAVAAESPSYDVQPLSPSELVKEKELFLRDRRKERRYIEKIGREIEEGYARQEAEETAKSAAELAAKRQVSRA